MQAPPSTADPSPSESKYRTRSIIRIQPPHSNLLAQRGAETPTAAPSWLASDTSLSLFIERKCACEWAACVCARFARCRD